MTTSPDPMSGKIMEDGRVPSAPGSREPDPSVPALSGFDPSRISALIDGEQLILNRLHVAHDRGEVAYPDFRDAFAVGICRIKALNTALRRALRDSDGSGQ